MQIESNILKKKSETKKERARGGSAEDGKKGQEARCISDLDSRISR